MARVPHRLRSAGRAVSAYYDDDLDQFIGDADERRYRMSIEDAREMHDRVRSSAKPKGKRPVSSRVRKGMARPNPTSRKLALPNMASDAVKAWRAEMRALHGPRWFEVPGVKDSRPGGRVAAKIKGKGPKVAAEKASRYGRAASADAGLKGGPRATLPSAGNFSTLAYSRNGVYLVHVFKSPDGDGWVVESTELDDDMGPMDGVEDDLYSTRKDAIASLKQRFKQFQLVKQSAYRNGY